MEHAERLGQKEEGCDQDLLSVLSGTTSFIFMVDRELRILFASPNALRIMGATGERILGKRFGELGITLDPMKDYEREMREAFETGNPRSAEISYSVPHVRRYYCYDMVPLVTAGGEDRLVLTARDITARKNSEILGEVLNRVYTAINSTMSFDEIMRRVIEASGKVMDSEATAVAIREGDVWVLRYGLGKIPPQALGTSLTDQQMRSCFLRSQGCSAGVLDIREADWVSREMMERFNIMSFISIPLSVRADIVGVLIFAFTQPRNFSGEEMDFATKLSTAISLSLDNSNLYRQERQRRFLMQTILDDIPAVIIDMGGEDLRIRWANRFSERYRFGQFKGKDTTGLTLESIIPNAELTGVAEMFRNVARTGRPYYDNEFMVSGLGDDVIYWSGALVPMRMGDQEVPDLLILASDVTDNVKARKRSEELARQADEEKARLRTILDTLPIGAALIDRSGRVFDVNPTARKFWEAVLPSFNNIHDLERVQAWNTDTGEPLGLEDWGMVKAIFKGVSSMNETVTLKRYDGQEIVMMMSSTPLLDRTRGVVGAVIIGQDITRQLQVQQEAVESRARAELYVDLLTHDINNLNAAAMGYMQLVQSVEGINEKARGWAARSLEALEESSRLIDSIKGIQMLESGKEAPTLIDLDEVLQRVVADHRDHPSRDVHITISSRGDHFILADQLVREVFVNLVDNAIKHSVGPLHIDITVSSIMETGREYHRVDIEDNGPGIPDELKDKVFSRAWRGRTKAVGKGLGLFLVRRLVEDLEGRVWVEDRVPGDHAKGSRFVVLLPFAPSPDRY